MPGLDGEPTDGLSPPRFDVHVHLAGTGALGSGCWLSPVFRERWTFRALRIVNGISRALMEGEVDDEWAAKLAAMVEESGVDYAVALGFDGVYDARGVFDEKLSQMIVPPEWVFEVCRRHPNLLPGPSLNPRRGDAMEVLERCIEGGAVLIKWLPPSQAFDPAAPSLDPFYARLAEARLPLLIHMGGERTFATLAPEMNDVEKLRPALEAGVPVICAHSATRILFSREPDQLPRLRRLLEEYPHLWLDNSGMANPGRYAHLPRLAQEELFTSRTLHGSDFPVPSNAVYYPRKLGPKRVLEIERIRNLIERDRLIKTLLGYPPESFTRASRVLRLGERKLSGARRSAGLDSPVTERAG
jgi:uncharacterized protein